jgi:acyl-[acyl carrier protein]--UDP-N-acetylglucosamine O-acyltransferase
MPISSLTASPLAIGRGLAGINVIGLERRGFAPKTITALRDLFRQLIRGNGLFASRLQDVKIHFSGQQNLIFCLILLIMLAAMVFASHSNAKRA